MPVLHGLGLIKKPGPNAARLFAFCALLFVAGIAALPEAHGFSVQRFGSSQFVRIDRSDMLQDGTRLGTRAEQTFATATAAMTLSSLADPVPVGLDQAIPGNVSAEDGRFIFFRIRLTRAEQRRCYQHDDFDVRLTSPGLSATAPGGGRLTLDAAEAVPWRNRRCSSSLWYGLRVRLGLAQALADSDYRGTLRTTVALQRPGGGQLAFDTPLVAQLPQVLMLYYPQRVQLNLEPSALTPLLASANGCGGDLCSDLGRVRLATNGSYQADAAITSAFPFATGTTTLNLQNVIAARAIGCGGNRYGTASYRVRGGPGVVAANGSFATIQGQPCGMDPRSGDLPLTLNLDSVIGAITASGRTRVRATIDVTVTGL